jgi:hypothetical protein
VEGGADFFGEHHPGTDRHHISKYEHPPEDMASKQGVRGVKRHQASLDTTKVVGERYERIPQLAVNDLHSP